MQLQKLQFHLFLWIQAAIYSSSYSGEETPHASSVEMFAESF